MCDVIDSLIEASLCVCDVAFDRGEMEHRKSVEIVDVEIGAVLRASPAHIPAEHGVRFPMKALKTSPV
jgi:hypothetical protein